MSNNEKTLDYYSRCAADYVQQTLTLDMAESRQILLDKLSPGAHILDAGCGSGRDSLAFKNAGYKVTAFDGCPEFAEHTSRLLEQPVRVIRFQDLAYGAIFDGIWASASLLHLEPVELEEAMPRLLRSLKKTGYMYASFKLGDGPRTDSAGRFFNDMTLERAQVLLDASGGELVSHHLSGDLMGRNTGWLGLLVRRAK